MTRTKAELKDYVCHHLKYDVLMVRAAHGQLHSGRVARTERNALLESFAIRTRVLLEFFFDRRPKKLGARAYHFCMRGAWKPVRAEVLKPINWRVNSEIAHASFVRIRYTAETRRWSTTKILTELDVLAAEFANKCKPAFMDERTLEVLTDQSIAHITSSESYAGAFSPSQSHQTFDDLPPGVVGLGLANIRIDGQLDATTST
jgi:hypothetical protein